MSKVGYWATPGTYAEMVEQVGQHLKNVESESFLFDSYAVELGDSRRGARVSQLVAQGLAPKLAEQLAHQLGAEATEAAKLLSDAWVRLGRLREALEEVERATKQAHTRPTMVIDG